MEGWGFRDKVILYQTHSQEPSPDLPAEYLAMSRQQAESVYGRADLLLNFHYAISPALLGCFRRTALVDIDPGLLQFWISRGQIRVPPHSSYFTIGEGISRGRAKVSDGGMEWIQIHPAVCLDYWPPVFSPSCEAFTTVSTWDSSDWVVDKEEVYENTK